MKKNSSIYFKIDWYSAVIHNTTIENVLHSVGIDWTVDLFDIFKEQFFRGTGFGKKFVFTSNGITMEVDTRDVPELFIDPITGEWIPNYDDKDYVEVHKVLLQTVRLDISGSGIDYMMNLGIPVVDKLRCTRYNGCNFNVTRCDFAYDLIDYKPEFVNALYYMCKDNETDTGRIRTGKASGFSYEGTTGRKEIVYIGSAGGGQMLRVYNKKLQLENRGLYLTKCPYGTPEERPESWIRIELQLRRNRAMGILTADNFNSETVFRYIYDNFGIRKADGSICKEWLDLYDWTEIPRIIQNLHYTDYKTVYERAVDNNSRNFKSFMVQISKIGVIEFIKWLQEQWTIMQLEEPVRAAYIRTACYSDGNPEYMIKNSHGLYQIALDKDELDNIKATNYISEIYRKHKIV